jgi:hypothetical protein
MDGTPLGIQQQLLSHNGSRCSYMYSLNLDGMAAATAERVNTIVVAMNGIRISINDQTPPDFPWDRCITETVFALSEREKARSVHHTRTRERANSACAMTFAHHQ